MDIRAFAQAFVKSAAVREIGANKTLRILQEMGLGYRRATFLADYRLYAKIPALSNRLKFIKRSYRPSKALFLEPKKFMRRRFAFTTRFKIFKPQTGETFTLSSRVATNKYYTRGQAERKAQEQIKEAMDKSKYEIVGATLAEAYHNPYEEW